MNCVNEQITALSDKIDAPLQLMMDAAFLNDFSLQENEGFD
jgi:hypothetical protein